MAERSFSIVAQFSTKIAVLRQNLLRFAARAAAPIVAKWVVTPIVGDIFQNQAALGEAAGLSPAVLAPVLKTVGIAILTHISAEVCRDAKESGIAAFVETAGAAVALCVALPLLRAVLDTVTGLL